MMKIVFMGCVEFSFLALRKVLSLKEAEVVGVITLQRSSMNSDFHSLKSLAAQHRISCLDADKKEDLKIAHWIKTLDADIIYCFGWSRLLSERILSACPMGTVGFHPAALPKNRGRHPIIWALASGLQETASTFFWMNREADAGDILDQKRILISNTDDAGDLYRKITATALRQIAGLTSRLASGTAKRISQDKSKANVWRKRGREDGRIDWRMSDRSIYNLVRALARPYPGAHCVYQGKEVPVWKVSPEFFPQPNLEPGKILDVKKRKIFVKCGENAIRLLEHGFKILPKKGEYL